MGTDRRQALFRRRTLLLLAGIFLVLPLGLSTGLSHLFLETIGRPTEPVSSDPVDSVVVFPNGSTLVAPRGTIGRQIADWLNSGRVGSRLFDVGGTQFTGQSLEPTMETEARLQRLATMLKANRDVRLSIIASAGLESSRAARLLKVLARDGVAPGQLSMGDVSHRTPSGRLSILITRPDLEAA